MIEPPFIFDQRHRKLSARLFVFVVSGGREEGAERERERERKRKEGKNEEEGRKVVFSIRIQSVDEAGEEEE